MLLLTTVLPGAGFWGRHQRHSLFGSALGRFAELDVLAFLTGGPPGDLATLEARASAEWGTRVRLHVCPAGRVSSSRLKRWALGALDYRRQPALQVAAGAAQAAAIEERIASVDPDQVVAFGIETMLPLLSVRCRLPPVDLDFDDVPHVRRWREARLPVSPLRRLLALSQVPGLLWAEQRMTAAARRSYVCSEVDRAYLTRRWRLPRVAIFPNAVPIPPPMPPPREKSLLFIGQLDYLPNAEAARFLIDSVWPAVRERLPEARLRIAGPSSEVLGSPSRLPPGVEVTGVVPRLEPLYARTAVACAPIHAGGGTRLKILEAAAFGRPVVSTRLGAEGLDLRDGEEIVLRDDARGFAAACCRLMAEPAESRRVGEAARRRVAALYERTDVVSRLSRQLASAS